MERELGRLGGSGCSVSGGDGVDSGVRLCGLAMRGALLSFCVGAGLAVQVSSAFALTGQALDHAVLLDHKLHKIKVRGHARVELNSSFSSKAKHGRYDRGSFTFRGERNQHCRVKYQQKDDTFYLWSNSHCKNGYWQLNMPAISEIEVAGRSHLRARDLVVKSSQPLTIKTRGHGRLDLYGKQVAVREIDHRSSGDVRLKGLNVSKLTINGQGDGVLTLQGKVSELTTNLWRRARVNASKLQADMLLATLGGRAKMWAQVRHTLLVRASGDSQLFYRPYPRRQVAELRERARFGFCADICTPVDSTNCQKD